VPGSASMNLALRLLVLLALVTVFTGCGQTQTGSHETEGSSLKPLGIYYGRFIGQHRGQPPKDEAEFKAFLTTVTPDELKSHNVGSVDEMFVSKRDGQPYVVVYGATTNPAIGQGGAPVIAYEKQGVGGKRYVATSMGAVEEVDEARFKQLVPGGA
jgi:hypothetical protein